MMPMFGSLSQTCQRHVAVTFGTMFLQSCALALVACILADWLMMDTDIYARAVVHTLLYKYK